MASFFQCNGCWNPAPSQEHSVASQCGHLFCLACAQAIIESDASTCPICEQVITKNNVKAVTVQNDPSAFKLTMAGQTPDVIMATARAAIQFYSDQQELYARAAQHKMQQKIDKTQENCRKKLTEVHNGYLMAKRKYQDVQHDKLVLLADNKELQEKYNHKAQQDKKLRDAVAVLQQENEALRRANEQMAGGGQRGGGGSGSMAMRLGGGGFNSGGVGLGGAGRPASRAGNFINENELGMRADYNMRNSLPGLGRQQLKEHSPLQSPGFNTGSMFAFETPANPPTMRTNIFNSHQLPASASKPLGLDRLGTIARPGAGGGFMGGANSSPSGIASL